MLEPLSNEGKISIGILAYGSLINEPGEELLPLITKRIPCITPFNVEYARMSKSRDYAPTLIPVKNNGAQVSAVVLVLKENISLAYAESTLWRRETRTFNSGKKYTRKTNPGSNTIQINVLDNFEGIDKVIYTSIPSNLGINSPDILADLAIKSILNDAGAKKLDGVRYLLEAKSNGIITPLTNEYEKCILEYTQTKSLQEAILKLDAERPAYLKKKAETAEFETQVIEIADLICSYGLNQTIQNRELNPAELQEIIEHNRDEFLKNCHIGFKKAQQKILGLMLAFETAKDNLKNKLREIDRNKNKKQFSEFKDSISSIESKEHVLRHLIDTIAWQMIKGQLYIARRLYQNVKGEKRLLKSNISSVVKAANEINKNEMDFALITDLSAYIQCGDIIVKKGDGTLGFVEVKEGTKNHDILNIIDNISNLNEPLEDIFKKIPLDKKSLEQLERSLKQYGEMIKLVSILNNDKGIDKSGRSVKIITPQEDTPRFDDKLHELRMQLETRNLWAYDVIDECLHVGMYKGPLRFIGLGILEYIGELSKNNFIIVDFLHVIRSLNKPLFFLPFPKEFLFDILFGRVKLFFMVDLDKYMMIFPHYGLRAEWLSRKETMKIVENRKEAELFIYKNRGIKVTSEASKHTMYLSVGILSKIYFEHIYPSYTAYSCTYLLNALETNDDDNIST